MPEPSPKLKIPRPLPNETVSLAAFREILDTIDANAASRAELANYTRKDQPETISGEWTIGADNQHILHKRSAELQIDTRTLVLIRDANGRLSQVQEKDGSTVVKTTTLIYDDSGLLVQVRETAGGKTVTSILNRDASGKLVSVDKEVA